MRGLFFLLLFLRIGLSQEESDQDNYYSPANVYRFANHLFEEQDYLRAADEYQRYLKQASNTGHVDSVIFRVALCYYYTDHYEDALGNLRRLIDTHPESGLHEESQIRTALSLLKMSDYQSLITYVRQKDLENFTPRARTNLKFLSGLGYLYREQWSSAGETFRYVYSDSSCPEELYNLSIRLEEVTEQAAALHLKSPVIAGLLSALVPGLGRAYIHRPGDGFFTMLLIGALSYQSYISYTTSGLMSLGLWFSAIPAVSLYLGNVYGSAVGAAIYNMEQKEKLLNQVQFNVDDFFLF